MELVGTYQMPLTAVRRLCEVRAAMGASLEGKATLSLKARGSLTTGQGRVAITETDRKAARALKASPDSVAAAARALWQRGLAEERDRRIGDAAATAQKRGRVTRQLLRELSSTLTRKRRK